MKIKRIQVHNVMGVKDVDADLEGHNLWLIGGKNRSGKSSTLQSVVMAICGKRGCDFPSEPLRDGEDEGWIKVTTDGCDEMHQSELVIERRFERRESGTVRDVFRIVGDEGFEAPEPQTLLSRLYQTRAFDPLAFSRMKPKDQLDALKSIVQVDTTEFDKQIKIAYDTRTDVNRDIKRLQATVDGFDIPEDTPDEEVDIQSLIAERDAIKEHNQKGDDLSSELSITEAQLESCNTSIKAIKEQIERLNEQLDETLKNRHKCEDRIKETTEALKAFTPKDVSAVQERISNSTAINRNVANKKRRDETREELAKQKKESHTLSGEIKLAEKAKAKAFKEAEWPVDGLAYDENGVTFNGLPFSQCSAAESIRVSIEMGMSLNPELKLLIVQHGECMDDETLEMVAKVVSEKDYQLLVEFMTRDADDEGRCQVVLEEGLVKELQPS